MSDSSQTGAVGNSPNFNSLKSRDGESKSNVSNPFETTKIKSYNHKPNIVPIYVLDTLSQVHYKDQLANDNVNHVSREQSEQSLRPGHTQSHTHVSMNPVTGAGHGNNSGNPNNGPSSKHNEDDYISFANDPFVKSMDNNWNKFLTSVKQPYHYTRDLITFDKDTVFENDLEGSWGGEERLKSALLGTPLSDDDHTYTNDTGKKTGFFSKFGSGRGSGTPNESPRVRSKAGYWMSDEKRADLLPFLKRIFVINPLVPLLLRVCIIFFSACALGLACTIYQFSNHKYSGSKVEQQPSTIMAIVVQCCAIVYVAYIAYDEYSGKPLGLRDPLGKMKLIMLDLLFIIFSSANLSLTFNTLYDDEWVCQRQTNIPFSTSRGVPAVVSICRRQRGLAAFLFMILGLWVLTFTISIIRVVDRVSVAGQRND